MQQAALFGPIVEARDVLESYLCDRILVVDWHQRLTEASRQFIELGSSSPNEDIAALGGRVAVLAESGLEQAQDLTREVAAELERLLDQVHVPDLPRPEDPDWAF
jgi:hypothetical protein